jgi:hypothetical protein
MVSLVPEALQIWHFGGPNFRLTEFSVLPPFELSIILRSQKSSQPTSALLGPHPKNFPQPYSYPPPATGCEIPDSGILLVFLSWLYFFNMLIKYKSYTDNKMKLYSFIKSSTYSYSKSKKEIETIRLTNILVHFMLRIKATFLETQISVFQNQIYHFLFPWKNLRKTLA